MNRTTPYLYDNEGWREYSDAFWRRTAAKYPDGLIPGVDCGPWQEPAVLLSSAELVKLATRSFRNG